MKIIKVTKKTNINDNIFITNEYVFDKFILLITENNITIYIEKDNCFYSLKENKLNKLNFNNEIKKIEGLKQLIIRKDVIIKKNKTCFNIYGLENKVLLKGELEILQNVSFPKSYSSYTNNTNKNSILNLIINDLKSGEVLNRIEVDLFFTEKKSNITTEIIKIDDGIKLYQVPVNLVSYDFFNSLDY